MRNPVTLLVVLCALSVSLTAAETPVQPLPDPVSDNAVAILRLHGRFELFSLMGIGAKKTWDAVSNTAYEVDAWSGNSSTIHPVPGVTGRIGAMAIGAAGHVFVFGGYVVYQKGGMAVPDSNVYEPEHDRWLRLADMPIPVGDAVIGVYRDRYIYVVGGRTNGRLVSDVQVYDLQKDRWSKGSASPGMPVFGHAGALVGNTIVYVDGARKNDSGEGPRFLPSTECWKGLIDHHNSMNIEWTKLPEHPGNAHFGIAAGGSEKDDAIYFSGGSDNPHDYNGIGYDGKPAEPSPVTFGYNLHSGKWETLNDQTPDPTMDHRGLLVTPEGLVIIGGMEKAQQVTANIQLLSKQAAPRSH